MSEEAANLLVEKASVGLGISDRYGRVLKANPAMREMMGYSEEELPQINVADTYVDPSDRLELLESIERDGKAENAEVRLKNRQGEQYWVRLSVVTTEYEGEEAFLTTAIDITEGKRAEAALEQRVRLERAIQQVAQTSLSSLDFDEVLDNLVNHVVRAGIFRSLAISLPDYESNTVETVRVCVRQPDGSWLGDKPEDQGTRCTLDSKDILAETVRTGEMQVAVEEDERFSDRSPPESHAGQVAYFIPVKKGDEVVAVLATGSTVDEREETLNKIELIRPLLDHVVVALENARLYRRSQEEISRRREAEEELRGSEERFRGIFEHTNSGVAVYEAVDDGEDFVFLDFNSRGERIEGTHREEMIGRRVTEVFPDVERFGLLDVLRRVRQTGTPEHHPVTRYQDDRVQGWRENFVYRLRSGEVVVVYDDLTEGKRAEEEQEKLRAQLSQAQKMESVGRLAGGVAHDHNNMLGVILGHVEMAQERVDPGEPLWVHLEEIRKAAERSADLTRQLLGFARKQTVAPKVLELNETVEGMLSVLRRLIGEDIGLAWMPGGKLGLVLMDPSQIEQTLANLCVNARDAIDGVGRVTIETKNITLDEGYCADRPGSVPGEYVLLAVSDDGCGMEHEVLDEIFEPFYTTKGVGEGPGLGLATVYGMVKQNEGFVDACSEPGVGTTFKIYLPRYRGQEEETEGA